MRSLLTTTTLLFIVASSPVAAESGDLFSGLPLIRYIPPKEYGASGQNWAVVQDRRGLIYVGNTEGLLEYDGVTWRLYPVPNGIVRSMTVNNAGVIFVGGIDEFGYLQTDHKDRVQYRSLTGILPPDEQNFDDVWSIYSADSLLIVQTFSRIFLINVMFDAESGSILTGEVTIVRTASMFFPACFLDNRFYVTEKNNGLLMLAGDSLIPVRGGVGGVNTTFTIAWAFYKEAGGELKNLGEYLANEKGVEGLEKWTMYWANAISADGQTIGGWGINKNDDRFSFQDAFLVRLTQRGSPLRWLSSPSSPSRSSTCSARESRYWPMASEERDFTV